MERVSGLGEARNRNFRFLTMLTRIRLKTLPEVTQASAVHVLSTIQSPFVEVLQRCWRLQLVRN